MLEAIDIKKSYNVPVLDGVSFSLSAGETVGVAGVNGCGKSTLLSVLTTVIRPDSGSVRIMGADAFREPSVLRKHVGYVPQENGLFETLSARDNIRYWASAYGVKPPEGAFDKPFMSKRVSKLSEGMKKRLSIAISLLNDPDLIIMDEPTAGLDIGFKQELLETVRNKKSEGKSVLFTSHQPDELMLCDRVLVMKNGKFIYDGPPGGIGGAEGFGGRLYSMMSDA